ncbi:RagB/SusD family nutrient uptake outer membrane protein [Hoylesella buccalis]|uniref:SusD family protein n=1 Tax=Hoylesella buccalis ATCC 35310 TaxID=679190 RepID=D1W566_9BACT|nr:RagB/SusD family nutrient uptake outer membrane protein [Hoylesella buccalis]EFA92267.1 SusD family protein [Hoylesella buccalis ATCC 35310]MCB6900920.1 RagB/SusD family nutrient uptake outer membrane protein [Hoylesella buccalis]UEA62638.1 RagB/SusD family nutrient uptake outer membrane protein [Hoylesella buccalis]UWP50076.1 RagB/SusD family nutrient uptake outer membrane protein [Hoylesella buccalis ATCC 35310]
MKTFKYFGILFIGLMITVSCSDILDKYPLDSVTNQTYWKTEEQLRSALYPCYDAFDYETLIKWAEATAETVLWGDVKSGLSKVSGGKHTYSDGFPMSSYWSRAYSNIYTCNNFLDNYNSAPIPQEVKDVYAGEVKVIRAYEYFMLTTFFGDVPWVDHVITSKEAYIARTSRSQVIDHILADLDWAAERLPAKRQLGVNVGRIDRWGALAMKARIALQNERYEIARDACREIMDNSPYGLYDYAKLYQQEGDVETNPKNNESIIFSLYVKDVRMHNTSREICSPVDYVRFMASKTLVDAFLCTDGKPAKAGLEYYHNNNVVTSDLYTYPEKHYADYFKNRDPRMRMTLYAPGDKWPGGDDGDKDVDNANPIFKLPRFASLSNNNRKGANSYTGFYFKKYSIINNIAYRKGHNNYNVIRYPEVLLTYAEALYKLNGTLTQQEIDETVNKLRNRVGMHPMKLDELKKWNMDLWTELKRERRVEMSFDGMRYADIMRWREGELRFGRAITGPSLTVCMNDLGRNPYPDNGVDEFGDIVHEKSTAEGGIRYFDPKKHYLWPVPYEERLKNPLLGQNPGWEE